MEALAITYLGGCKFVNALVQTIATLWKEEHAVKKKNRGALIAEQFDAR